VRFLGTRAKNRASREDLTQDLLDEWASQINVFEDDCCRDFEDAAAGSGELRRASPEDGDALIAFAEKVEIDYFELSLRAIR